MLVPIALICIGSLGFGVPKVCCSDSDSEGLGYGINLPIFKNIEIADPEDRFLQVVTTIERNPLTVTSEDAAKTERSLRLLARDSIRMAGIMGDNLLSVGRAGKQGGTGKELKSIMLSIGQCGQERIDNMAPMIRQIILAQVERIQQAARPKPAAPKLTPVARPVAPAGNGTVRIAPGNQTAGSPTRTGSTVVGPVPATGK